jgi:hypothetical protein
MLQTKPQTQVAIISRLEFSFSQVDVDASNSLDFFEVLTLLAFLVQKCGYWHTWRNQVHVSVVFDDARRCLQRHGAGVLAHVCARMRTYAHVCARMLTYAHVCSRMLTYAHVCSRMLTYTDVYWRMLTYADVCWRMLTQDGTHTDIRCSKAQALK